jgi:hypothetical protein
MKISPIALAVAAAFGATVANAVSVPVNLASHLSLSSGGESAADLSTSTATWSYDTVTGAITGSGLLRSQFQIRPDIPGQLFTHEIADLTLQDDAAATAASFECIDGIFGFSVGASLCGNYSFGANLLDESATIYGPGTNVSQTLGGDDASVGAPQDLSLYDGNGTLTTWNGTTVVWTNADMINYTGYSFTFVTVPVPAALWLFGSALGLLGWMRKHKGHEQ